jgi:prevent-host-death family protein
MVMERVNISTLKARLSHYIREARRGREVIVVDRDRVVARIVRADEGSEGVSEERLLHLAEQGLVSLPRLAHVPADIFDDLPECKHSVVTALLEEREQGP